MAGGMVAAHPNARSWVKTVLLGGSKREARVLAITTWLLFWMLALTSAVAGVGWYRSPGICTGIESMAYHFDLNPVLYLPYWIAGWGRCHPVFHPEYHMDRSLLGHLVESPGSPQLYAATVLWWMLAAYATGRLIAFLYGRIRSVSTVGGSGRAS